MAYNCFCLLGKQHKRDLAYSPVRGDEERDKREETLSVFSAKLCPSAFEKMKIEFIVWYHPLHSDLHCNILAAVPDYFPVSETFFIGQCVMIWLK